MNKQIHFAVVIAAFIFFLGILSSVDVNEKEVVAAGDPAPAQGDTVYLDTRNWLNIADNIAEADCMFNINSSVGCTNIADRAFNTVNFTTAAFTTDMDGQGTHAWRRDYVATTCLDGGIYLNLEFPDNPTEVYVQWKMHMGRTTTGGGIGQIATFDLYNETSCYGGAGRKMGIMIRASGTNQNRVDYLWRGASPIDVDIDTNYDIPHNVFDPEDYIGQDLIQTVYLKAETSDLANDGVIRVWIDGVLVLEETNVNATTEGYSGWHLPSTFNSPQIDQTEYFWDVVTWAPAGNGLVDTTAPTVSITAPTASQALPVNTTSTTLAVTTNEAATCKWNNTDASYASMVNTFSSTGGTSHTTTMSGFSNGQSYTRYVRCMDTSSNVNGTSQSRFFTITAGADTTPPTVSITAPTASQILAADTTSTSLTVTTNETATCKWNTTDVAYASMSNTFSSTGATSHSTTLSGLTNGTSYTRYVRCIDSSSNANTSSQSRSFSVASAVDSTAPVVSITAPTASQILVVDTTSTTLSVTTDEAATCKWNTTDVAYGSMSNTFSSTGGTSHSTTLSSLTNGSSYTRYVRCVDGSSNANSSSQSRSFSVASVVDSTAPVRSSASPSGVLAEDTSSTLLSVTTNEAATCRLSTSSGVAYASMSNTFNSTGGTTHTETVTGLLNGTDYAYYVRCIDASSNANTSDEVISFSIAPTTLVSVTPGATRSSSGGGGGGGATTNRPVTTTTTGDTSTQSLIAQLVNSNRVLFNQARSMGITLPQYIIDILDGVTVASVSTSYGTFTQNLTLNASGNEVTALQQILIRANAGPAAQALSAFGASGFFGSITQAALAEYQAAHGISPAIGYFGPTTRAHFNTIAY